MEFESLRKKSLQRRHNERDGFLKSAASRLFTQPFIQAQV